MKKLVLAASVLSLAVGVCAFADSTDQMPASQPAQQQVMPAQNQDNTMTNSTDQNGNATNDAVDQKKMDDMKNPSTDTTIHQPAAPMTATPAPTGLQDTDK